MKRVSLVIVVLCLAVANLMAQAQIQDSIKKGKKEHHARGERNQHRKDFRQAVQQYADSVIEPVVRVQSRKLAKLLSAQEKEQVLAVKAQLGEFGRPPQQKGGKPDFKRERPNKPDSNFAHHRKPDSNFVHRGKPDSTFRAKMKAKRQEIDSLKALLNPIVVNHQVQIDSLGKTLDSQEKVWLADIAKIAKQHHIKTDSIEKRFDKNIDRRFDATDMILRGVHKQRKPHKECSQSVADTIRGNTLKTSPAPSEVVSEVSAYPNPANSSFAITYTLKEDANITIKMVNGNVTVKTIVNNERQSAGKQTFTVNTSNLQPGVYYYQITTPSGLITRKIMIVK